MMTKIENIREALAYLNDKEIITSNGRDLFVAKDDKVHVYDSGSHFVLSVKEFVELYEKCQFYIKEEGVEIDETKDEAYYRYYKK